MGSRFISLEAAQVELKVQKLSVFKWKQKSQQNQANVLLVSIQSMLKQNYKHVWSAYMITNNICTVLKRSTCTGNRKQIKMFI